MKGTIPFLLILLLFIPSLACGSFTANSIVGSGDIVTQSFQVGSFERVSLEGFGSVFIDQGSTESLSVQTDDNIMPLLDIQVQDNTLRLGIKRGYDVTPSQSITFKLTVEDLKAIELDGSGSFDVEPVKSDHLTVSIQGSGDINIQGLTADDLSIDLDGSGNIAVEEITVKTVETSIQGSGDIALEGQAQSQEVTVAGSGNYLAGDLETMNADIRIPGSGNLTIWVNDELNVRVNGSGDVRYYGQPVIDQSVSGSGNVISLGEK